MTTFKRLATTKRTAWFLGLIWVLLSRHTLERGFEPSSGNLSLPVFISRTDAVQRWLVEKMLKERESERGQVSYSLCCHSVFALPVPWWQIWHYVGGGPTSDAQLLWLPGHWQTVPSISESPMTSLWPFKQNARAPYGDFQKCYLKTQGLYEEHS